jgi:hypothetical protein
MGQFKPMVKMMTTEPSVILKLKKGGKVESKANGGYMPMQSTMFAQMPAGMPARGGLAPAASPMKPSMAMRRRAMNPNMMKKGGSACGDVMEELKEHEAKPMKKAHKAMKGGGNVSTFANTKMVDGDKNDSAKGTGKVKNGNAGGFATGGTIKGNVAKFANTKVVDGDKTDTAKGTGGVKMGNKGGFKMGGTVDNTACWENRPANTAKAGKSGTTTSGVRNGNAGGYKMGGSTKKAYATGGTVDTGKAVAMPKKPVSRPVANSLQSGTFKKGGKVGKYSEAGPVDAKAVSDKASRELEEAMNPISMAKELYGKAKSYLTSSPTTPGAVTKTKESVTVAPRKKSGGKC